MDAVGNQECAKVREIEEHLFTKTKGDVINSTGPWIGSSEQNKMADIKIAGMVRNSFKSYERNRPLEEKKWFKF